MEKNCADLVIASLYTNMGAPLARGGGRPHPQTETFIDSILVTDLAATRFLRWEAFFKRTGTFINYILGGRPHPQTETFIDYFPVTDAAPARSFNPPGPAADSLPYPGRSCSSSPGLITLDRNYPLVTSWELMEPRLLELLSFLSQVLHRAHHPRGELFIDAVYETLKAVATEEGPPRGRSNAGQIFKSASACSC